MGLLEGIKNSWNSFISGPLPKYYFWGLFPIFGFSFLFFVVGIFKLNIALFLLGFLWPYAIWTPGISEKVKEKEYRFSFLKFSYFFHQKIQKFLSAPKRISVVWAVRWADLSFPLFLGVALFALTLRANPLYVFIGWGGWLLFCFCVKKKGHFHS